MDMKIRNRNHVIPADKYAWSMFERTKCGPKGERQEACSNAGIQRVESLDYRIHPCILPCGPAFGCSNLLRQI